MNSKPNVLIIQGTISHYNVPVYNVLNEKYNITLMHSDIKCIGKEYKFKTIYNPCVKIRKNIHKKNVIRIANSFDVVVCMMDFSYLYFHLLNKKKRKYKLIYWGIGVSASYTKRFDEDQTSVSKYLDWINKSDAVVFYSDYAKNKYINLGIDSKKLYVAPNTVNVNKIVPDEKRQNYLFVGSLYPAKKVDLLIHAYCKAYIKDSNLAPLYIIGNGSEKENLGNIVRENGLQSNIVFCGEITDEKQLEGYFKESILCISPDQAGLTVLKSMGYGVPFATSCNAFTGGERLNIINDRNGFLFDSFDAIENLILDAHNDKKKYLNIGDNAYEYYWSSRKIEDMAMGFVNAINYVLKEYEE